MIFNPPARKKGALNMAGKDRKKPVSVGEMAAPTERAIPVTPEAADLSSGATTAMVYDWRVGTSICEILKRASRTAMASGRVGISGTSILSLIHISEPTRLGM